MTKLKKKIQARGLFQTCMPEPFFRGPGAMGHSGPRAWVFDTVDETNITLIKKSDIITLNATKK
jgi:hypothetical protein